MTFATSDNKIGKATAFGAVSPTLFGQIVQAQLQASVLTGGTMPPFLLHGASLDNIPDRGLLNVMNQVINYDANYRI